MKIATWNVNSIRARLAGLRDWLQKRQPDVVCLQETKVTDEAFPYETLEDEGYNIVAWGQQTYNGVAILSKFRIEDVIKGLPNEDEDAERRVAPDRDAQHGFDLRTLDALAVEEARIQHGRRRVDDPPGRQRLGDDSA